MFTNEHVDAILAGRKTMTRRAMKLPPGVDTGLAVSPWEDPPFKLCVKEPWSVDGQPRSPMFMPRARSRVTIEVTGVSSQRLLSITQEDAKAEGALSIEEYRDIWEKINAKHPERAWHRNPLVWVLQFRIAATKDE